MSYKARFGDALRTARINAGLSQTELAEKISALGYPVSNGTISNYETGYTKRVSDSFREAASDALNLPHSFFPESNEIRSDDADETVTTGLRVEILDYDPLPDIPLNQNPYNTPTATPYVSYRDQIEARLTPMQRVIYRFIDQTYHDWKNYPFDTGPHWWGYLAIKMVERFGLTPDAHWKEPQRPEKLPVRPDDI